MAKPAWRELKVVDVDSARLSVWTLAVDYVDPGRLLKMTVAEVSAPKQESPVANETPLVKKGEPETKTETPPPKQPTTQQTWSLSPTEQVNANGLPVMASRTSLLLSTAPRGALIGKIGGSTADVPAATDAADPESHQRLFAVGAFCVVEVGAKGGPLFLTMNDDLGNFNRHHGILHVTVEES